MSNSILKKAKDICIMTEQIIDVSDKFLIDKSILYCKFVLSLNKDYVESAYVNFQKEIGEYLIELVTYLSNK